MVILLFNANNSHFVEPTVHIVKIEGMKFVPKTIEIKVGDKVRWINESKTRHNIEAKDGTFKSQMLTNKQTFEHTFTKTGTHKYVCRPHRFMGMKGRVIVKMNPGRLSNKNEHL